MELEDVTGIGAKTAERMKKAGITSIEKLAGIDLKELLKIKGIGKSSAESYIEEAKKILKSTEKEKAPKEKKPKKVPKEEEKPKKKPQKEEKEKPKKKPTKGKKENIKERIKGQAECNIGLVGHVDHGKTTLVQSLSGEWTDRHSEEQERGISIKLGYSNATILYCPQCDKYLTFHMAEEKREKGKPRFKCPHCQGDLEFKRNISFVDAPGHEILMATMLSGASLMDGACLLIAADEECPQPQTREHLAALDIAGIENVIIVQNKIDAVSKPEAKRNYQQIKEFIKGTVAEDAPIIPISAIFSINIENVIRGFEEVIPTPKLSEDEEFQFLIARSFDINKPGTKIEKLNGGVIGGSVLKGKIEVGEKIEIRPGLKIKDKYQPIRSEVVSISQGRNFMDEARPGGLIGLGTKLDPALTKGDSLIGHLVGKPDSLPEVIDEVELDVHLLDRVIGTEDQIKVHELKHNERLLIVIGTEKAAGTVVKILKNSYIIKLNPPICPPEDFIFAISRIINRRYRLIGYGLRVNQEE
ncbi:MAG: Translation initiation factor 2 subunit gamma [Promethearchaeota archaeon]|nr:MAG: Translation initiation factor 2 subunit gamma [Candidatus Lokiarchaeota archaeon]